MPTGKVKWFNPVMGHGYIKPTDGGAEIPVRRFAVEMAGYRSLQRGQRLQYEVGSGIDGKLTARTLKLIE